MSGKSNEEAGIALPRASFTATFAVFVIAIVWFAQDPDYEPLILLVGGLISATSTLAKTLQDKSRKKVDLIVSAFIIVLFLGGIIFVVIRTISLQTRSYAISLVNTPLLFTLSCLLLLIVISWVFKPDVFHWVKRFKLTVAVVLVVTFTILFGFIFPWFPTQVEQGTVYFIIDASENTKPFWEEIRPRLALETMRVPSQVEIGLAVFGSNLGGKHGCNDVIELVKPASGKISIPEIEIAVDLLTEVQSYGVGTLQESVLFAISQLKEREGVHQIFVITSGLDERCGSLNRGTTNESAVTSNVQFELIILTVGDLNETDEKVLQVYADKHIHLGMKVEELPEIIEEILNNPPLYFNPYGYGYTP